MAVDTVRLYPKSTEKQELFYIFSINTSVFNQSQVIHFKQEKTTRIISLNVHLWTDINNVINLLQIKKLLLDLAPDIVLLQEATVDFEFTQKQIAKDIIGDLDLHLFFSKIDYVILSFCNNVPTIATMTYGNMILVKKLFLLQIEETNVGLYSRLCCSTTKCKLCQLVHTYGDIDCCKQRSSKVFPVLDYETRCFIKISLPDYDIIVTHLEAYDREKREKQIDILNENITRFTLVCGDFNCICENDYKTEESQTFLKLLEKQQYAYYENSLQTYKYIEQLETTTQNKWIDLFRRHNKNEMYTCWNSTRVDYMFVVYPKNVEKIINLLLIKNLDEIIPALRQMLPELNLFLLSYIDVYDKLITVDEFNSIPIILTTPPVNGEKLGNLYMLFSKIKEIYESLLNPTKLELVFNRSSDHLPLLIDVKNNYAPVKQKEFHTEYPYVVFLKLWDIKHNSKDEDRFCNTQMFVHYNWLIPTIDRKMTVHRRFNYQDPTLLGTTVQGNILGVMGIYFASLSNVCDRWMPAIQTRYNTLSGHQNPPFVHNILVIFIFDLHHNENTKQVLDDLFIPGQVSSDTYNEVYSILTNMSVGKFTPTCCENLYLIGKKIKLMDGSNDFKHTELWSETYNYITKTVLFTSKDLTHEVPFDKYFQTMNTFDFNGIVTSEQALTFYKRFISQTDTQHGSSYLSKYYKYKQKYLQQKYH